MITRRAILAGGAASAFGAIPKSVGAQTAETYAKHSFKVGSFEVTVVSDGTLALPVTFLLPTAPKPEVEALLRGTGLPVDALPTAVNVVIIKAGGDLILVDTGAGGDFMPGLGRFADALDAAGVKAEAVTKVVFTHAHADHLWGVLDPFDETRFPKAEHIITAAEHNFWSAADAEARVAEPFKRMAVGTQRRLKLLHERFVMRKPGDEIAPGVTLIDTAGHTPGHVSVLLNSGGNQLLIGGDVLNQSVVSFAKPDWRWGADMDPELAIAARKRTLDMLATDRISLLGYHLPWPGLGRVERKDTAFRFIAG
jgi:glyoxylase-like metal-dependent hydrolase (beta-lactamase superfamily II)